MKTKISIISILICLLIAITGCSGGDKPDKTVSEFIEGMKKFDLELMASKINPEDRKDVDEMTNLSEEGDLMEKYFLDYIKSNAKKINYKINDSKIDGDKAVVSVDFKYVDGGPLFRATFAEYMKEMFALAFTDMNREITQEEYNEAFVSAMEEQSKVIEESFTEKTLEINCIKVDDKWYINEPSDEILDVAMSNLISVGEELNESFDGDAEDDSDESSIQDELSSEDVNLIEKNIGDEIELNTFNFKITKVEETDTLTSEYGEDVSAKEGAKFVVVGMEVTNTTKSELTFPDDFILVDNEEREFNTYEDTYFAIDDYLNERDLAPSIKEKGYLVYEVPEDAISYYTFMGKAETKDIYKIVLK